MPAIKHPVEINRRIISTRHVAVSAISVFWHVLISILPLSFCEFTSANALESIKCDPQGSRPFCVFPKSIVDQCAVLSSNSIFAQCNVYGLAIGQITTKHDDLGNSYVSIVFKYSERNNCLTGANASFAPLGKCDTFAAYVQILRHLRTGKCFALVNSALLGMQRKEEVFRNDPNRVVQKLEIPGIYRRITFSPTSSYLLLGQSSSILVQSNNSQRPYLRSGPTISALSPLELDSNLTVKRENLKSDIAKIRLTRGISTNSDSLDFILSRSEQKMLLDVLLGCQ